MKRLAVTFLVLLAAWPAAAGADYGATVAGTAGLVSYWPLDETAGPTIADVKANSSATLGPTAAFGLPPGIDAGGTSVLLAGTTVARLGNVDNFTGDFTLEAWVAQSSTAGDQYVFSKGTGSAGYHLLLLAGGVPAFQVNGTRITAPPLGSGGWHQVVATVTAGALAIYVDGRPAASGTITRAPVSSSQSLTIGRSSRQAAFYYQGGLDELSAYDRSLDAATVAAHFAAGAGTSVPRTLISAAPPALSTTPDGSFAFAGPTGGLTFRCALDGGTPAPCPGRFAYSRLRDGVHTLTITATNRSGDVESPAVSYSWKIDATPPETFVLATRPTQATSATALLGSEAGARFECRLGDGAWTACGAPLALPQVAAPTQLAVRAVDPAGNADPSPAALELDPPDPAAPVLFSGASQSFAVGGNRSVSTLQCSLDGAAAQSCPSPLDFTGLAYGPHTLAVTDPKLPSVVFPTMSWTSALPIPLLAGSQFPALLSLGTHGAQAHVAKSRLPRLLFQSSAAGSAAVRMLRGGRVVWHWRSPVIQGSNLVALPRAAYRRLRPGRYGLELRVANASGTSRALRLRFDAARLGR